MGDRVDASALVVGRDCEVQRRLQRCVAALQRMVDDGWFVGHEDTIGMEVELDLVDPLGRPRLINDAVLARLGRADMQRRARSVQRRAEPGSPPAAGPRAA